MGPEHLTLEFFCLLEFLIQIGSVDGQMWGLPRGLRKFLASLFQDNELKEQIRQKEGSGHIPCQERSRKYWI